MTKFVINDPEILIEIPEEHRSKEVKEFGPKSVGKVLGVKWNILDDTLYFDVSCKPEAKVTRRHMLSMIASMYDPLGLVGPMILTGKLLFQEGTRRKIHWDEVIPPNLKNQWDEWMSSFKENREIKVTKMLKAPTA